MAIVQPDAADGQQLAALAVELIAALPDPLAELELWRQLARGAYERGRADGWRQGYEQAEADMAQRWNAIAGPVARGGLTHEELEELRYGPGGREHFGDPRPSDYTPGPRQETAA